MTSRVSLAKDSIDVILKLFILSLFVSAMLLWTYLLSINAKGLFLDAISSKEGLAAVLFVAVLMLVAFFLQMWMPSLVVVAASTMANGKLDEATDYPARYFIYVFAIWLALLVAMTMSFEGGWVIFAVIGGTLAAAALLFRLRQRKKGPGWKLFSFGMPAAATFAAMVTALPMSMFGNVLGPNARTIDAIIAFVFTILVSFCGYWPSLFYLNARRWAKKAHQPILYGLLGAAMSVIVLVMYLAIIPRGFSTLVMEIMGVRSDQASTFELTRPELADAAQLAGIPVKRGDGNAVSIKAYSRFVFGDVRLLCRDPYDPNIIGNRAKGFVSDDTEKKQVAEARKRASAGCVVYRKDDIRPFSL
ncbi:MULTISPECIES: hypothetical protein [Ralstonia solanacearum species complex]|uniref:hypothetical protein n=1 Tax=Ralstonia pseudosolanacearum TaxID=1310165 RepID=UPI0008F92B97|nr:hypothetical protein RSOE_08685 [Ralstonia solanacearum OE1-1]API76117.1 hypothetical protein AC251_17155 [Ralstonia pseudosolanacearum]NKA09121.1 hypothetical protein [Ralstonia solanacearum]OIN72044.1 hypothetical protein BL247_12830 [Ralstonia solanacearum]BCM03947.1 hypothetical protein MAFF301560_33340 [Ralstonia solanacearum]